MRLRRKVEERVVCVPKSRRYLSGSCLPAAGGSPLQKKSKMPNENWAFVFLNDTADIGGGENWSYTILHVLRGLCGEFIITTG